MSGQRPGGGGGGGDPLKEEFVGVVGGGVVDDPAAALLGEHAVRSTTLKVATGSILLIGSTFLHGR